MKVKNRLVVLLGLIAGVSSLQASVTISFNSPFVGGMSGGFANTGGVVTNGMHWGIFIDGSNNGLVDYAPITPSVNAIVNLVNATTSIATDDWMYFAGDLTADSSQGGVLSEGDFVTPGANGGVSTFINLNLVSPALAGKAFSLFWLEGGKAGLLSDAQFILPPDGSTVTFDNPFVGVDPVRTAGLAYSGTSGTSTGPAVNFVPEPSAALLGAIGALGLLRRRRN